MQDMLQRDVQNVQRKSVSQASEFTTRSTVGLMLSQTVIDNLVIGGKYTILLFAEYYSGAHKYFLR